MIVPKAQANYILSLSALSFLSGFYGLSQGHYTYGSIPVSVGLTTILFWSHPINGWRRWLDIAVSVGGAVVLLSNATGAENRVPYYTLKAAAISCYPLGHYCYNRGFAWGGMLWHGGIHILGNLANVVLYSGRI